MVASQLLLLLHLFFFKPQDTYGKSREEEGHVTRLMAHYTFSGEVGELGLIDI